ncbi:MAG: hypothetical protein JO061_00490, partial [Acidobacteriaceae bacterium]|nr:hypothetical protein [Acidobacteriaceae bacterium]
MLHVIIYLNRAGAVIFACLLNTGLIAVAVVAMALLLARLKTWSAATRCSLWWIAIALVIASPFAGGLLTQHQAAPMMAISAKSSVVHLLATRHAPDPGVPSSPRVGLSAVGLCLLC